MKLIRLLLLHQDPGTHCRRRCRKPSSGAVGGKRTILHYAPSNLVPFGLLIPYIRLIVRRCPSEYQVRLQPIQDQLGVDGAHARFRLIVERFADLGKCAAPHSQEWHALARRAPPDVRPGEVFEHPTIVRQRFRILQDDERREQSLRNEQRLYKQRSACVRSDTTRFLSVLRLWIWTKFWSITPA